LHVIDYNSFLIIFRCVVGLQSQKFNYENWDESWNPEIFIENSFPETEERVSYCLCYDKQGVAVIEERRIVRGRFFECLELFEYPFDKQVGL